MAHWEFYPTDTTGALRGRPLRYVLTHILFERQREAARRPGLGATMTIAELVAACEAAGVVFDGRASKIVSDALRWEVRRGRAKRLDRSIYRFGSAPRSTMWRIRKRSREFLARLGELLHERTVAEAFRHSGVYAPRIMPLLQ